MSERASRVRRVLGEQFGDGDGETVLASAPGRVNLIGGHTDYNEGFVLPTAIDRRTTVAARPRDDDVLDVYSIDFDEREAVDLDDLRPRDDPRWLDYVQGVAHHLRERGHDVGGADLVIDGGVPMGAGLASSAAVEVATGAALADAAGADVDDEELATACWEAENRFVGVGCGIMDQFAATFTEADSALFLDCRSREHEAVPFDSERYSVLVTDTNVQHALVDSAYNERVEQCAEGVEALAAALDRPLSALRDVSPGEFEAHADSLPEVVRRRCRHVIGENDRVEEAAAALQRGDVERVGELMEASHASLRDDYEVSCEELDAVVDVAGEQEGVLGSRMTGAGFGGCVVSLVQASAVEDVEAAVRRQYEELTGVEPDVYACAPAEGLRRE